MNSFFPVKFISGEVRYLWGGRWLSTTQILDRKKKNSLYSKKFRNKGYKKSIPAPLDTGFETFIYDGIEVKRKKFIPVTFHNGSPFFFYEGRWMRSGQIQKRLERNKLYHKKNRVVIAQRKNQQRKDSGYNQKTHQLRKIGVWRKWYDQASFRAYSIKYYYAHRDLILFKNKQPRVLELKRMSASRRRRRVNPYILVVDAMTKLSNGAISFEDFIGEVDFAISKVKTITRGKHG